MDHNAAKAFPAELTPHRTPAKLANLIEEKGYLPEQVFNANETNLFWKKIPTRTVISQRESKAASFKVAKDGVSLLLCANGEGDFMVKPMMLYRSLNLRALKNKNKQTLPV